MSYKDRIIDIIEKKARIVVEISQKQAEINDLFDSCTACYEDLDNLFDEIEAVDPECYRGLKVEGTESVSANIVHDGKVINVVRLRNHGAFDTRFSIVELPTLL